MGQPSRRGALALLYEDPGEYSQVDAVGDGSLWGTTTYGGIERIDPASTRVVGKAVPAGTSPSSIASPTGLWVTDFNTGDLLHLVIASRP